MMGRRDWFEACHEKERAEGKSHVVSHAWIPTSYVLVYGVWCMVIKEQAGFENSSILRIYPRMHSMCFFPTVPH